MISANQFTPDAYLLWATPTTAIAIVAQAIRERQGVYLFYKGDDVGVIFTSVPYGKQIDQQGQGKPVYSEAVRGIVQTPHNYLEFQREATNEAGPGRSGQWNSRYLRGLDARGLCLGSMSTTPDFTKYPYPSGLPWFAPRPTSDEPDLWSRKSVVLWKDTP